MATRVYKTVDSRNSNQKRTCTKYNIVKHFNSTKFLQNVFTETTGCGDKGCKHEDIAKLGWPIIIMYVDLLNTIYVQIFAIFVIEPRAANLAHVEN